LIRVLISECDDFEDCDVTSMTSWRHVSRETWRHRLRH